MTRSIVIRVAQVKDLAAIIYLIQEFAEFENLSDACKISENDLREVMFSENKFIHCLIAESENELIGYAIFFPVFKSFRGERSMFLEDLYVSPKIRGQGLGLRMLKEVARTAKKSGCVRMDWQALKWNEPAIEFYEKLGAEYGDENFDFSLRGENFEKMIY